MTSPELDVLVAGGTGFLGRAFVRRLTADSQRVGVLSRNPDRVAGLFSESAIDARYGDVVQPETLPAALRGVHTVVQTVQFAGFPVETPARGLTFMDVDAAGTRNLAEAAVSAGVRRLIYLSGVGAAPDAAQSWFRAKAIAEDAIRDSGIPHTIIRPSWVYGPEDVSLNRFVSLVRRVPLVFPQVGGGLQRLNPVFVDDVAALVAQIAGPSGAPAEPDTPGGQNGTALPGDTLEIGGPVTYSMDGIVQLVMEALGRPKPILHVPSGLALCGAGLLELLPGRVLSRDALRFATQGAVADNGRLRQRFPRFRLTPMPDALASYLSG